MSDLPHQPVASHHLWIKESCDALGFSKLHHAIVEDLAEGIEAFAGAAAAERVRREGIEILHELIDATQIGLLRDFVLDRRRSELLRMAVAIGRNRLHWPGEFYVDDYLILRINFPYEVARKSDPKAENPGIGRVSPQMREIARARRVSDPLYDPKSYHREAPPAAWAHGPHLDSWAGHSTDGLNIWWAMCEVPAQASMVLYPALAGRELPVEQRTLYLKAGYQLPVPTFLPLKAGEMLIFDPEILHGTHLNVTMQTRVAVSLRLNSKKPSFDPDCFYARELWRRASDIEAGRDDIQHLKREDNLALARRAASIEWPERAKDLNAHYESDGQTCILAPKPAIAEGGRAFVILPDRRVLLQRVGGTLVAIDDACPHYGVSLRDGGHDDRAVYCPACGVKFDLKTGSSGAPSLALTHYRVAEDGGAVTLTIASR